MDAIEIINFAKKPINEVWFLRVTTVSRNWKPITITAFRNLSHSKESLIYDLALMVNARVEKLMPSLVTRKVKLEVMKEWDRSDGVTQVTAQANWPEITGPHLEEALNIIWDDGIRCILDNYHDSAIFTIRPDSLPKTERPPHSHSLGAATEHTAAFFIKCVRVKVK